MADKRPRAAEKRPRFTGPKITLSKEERDRLRAQREARGLTTQQLADRVGASQASISNLETGRHPQVYKALYMRVVKYLFRPGDREPAADEEAAFFELTNDLADLTGKEIAAARAFVAALKSPRKSQ